MKVSIEEIPKVELGAKGVLVRIRDNDDKYLGKLRVGKAKITWAKGNTPERNGKTLSMKDFVDYLNQLP